ncbi:GNAT family N-acetyltransferase [Amaricoccus solimangrovi]|uniref:GNAT family N-acetyltransferase n=1 Tax=Amaricoccus solimangrovi TaxID=2589815 RepID=A0A501WEZ3_9RHOB|nr:GNAT family N-acetyltransferase [Amaricoccus solimangrovi]TPE47372.1 GNAT family N-acetyltransferase [Amaricoccus solimangrovi]
MALETHRLILRPWEARDAAPFAAMNADPEVMRHFPKPLDRERSDALMARIETQRQRDGYGIEAVERRADGAFLGMVGISHIDDMPGTPVHGMVEAAWRLARSAWGQGYATEAASAAITRGFATLGIDAVVAFTARPNLRSQAVMTRLGMVRAPELDFEHPGVPEGSPLRPHVSFRVTREAWGRR